MGENSGSLVQGTLDMLILKTLALEPMHGYGIAQRIEQISNGVFHVNPGSLFPAFPQAGALRFDQASVETYRE
jgi:PadR family transcriptional regulator, regulatory protein PadR